MSVIFRGSTAACLSHLVDATRDTYLETRNVVAAFTGISAPTVYRWTKGVMSPAGEPLIRLRFYLDFLGYDVEELRGLHPSIRGAAACYAFGLVTIEEIAKLLDYPHTKSGVSMTLSLFRGAHGTTSAKLELLTLLAEEHAEALADAQKRTTSVLVSREATKEGISSDTVHVPEEAPRLRASASSQRSTPRKQNERGALIESFAGSVKALIPLAQILVSDDVTPAERAYVRELAGGDGVFTLANALFRLCGERARKAHTSNQQNRS